MGFFDNTSVSNTTTKQTDQKATTQTGNAFASGGGTQTITDGGLYEKGVESFKSIFQKQLDTTATQQKSIADQTNKLVGLTGNLLQRKSESDSKELSEKALKWGSILVAIWLIMKVFK